MRKWDILEKYVKKTNLKNSKQKRQKIFKKNINRMNDKLYITKK